MKKSTSSFFVQIFQWGMTALLLLLLIIAIFRPDLAEQAIRWVGDLSVRLGHWNFPIVLATSLIESFPVIGILVPGQQLMLVVGWFYGQSNFPLAMLWACIGAILWNWISYMLGARYGLEFLKNYGDTFALGKTEQKILSKQIQKNGAVFIILWKFHSFTRAFVPFLAGAFSMKNEKFWLFNIMGSIIWSFTILVLWVFFTTHIDIVLDWISWFFIGVVLLLVWYIAMFKRKEFLEYLKEKQKDLQE